MILAPRSPYLVWKEKNRFECSIEKKVFWQSSTCSIDNHGWNVCSCIEFLSIVLMYLEFVHQIGPYEDVGASLVPIHEKVNDFLAAPYTVCQQGVFVMTRIARLWHCFWQFCGINCLTRKLILAEITFIGDFHCTGLDCLESQFGRVPQSPNLAGIAHLHLFYAACTSCDLTTYRYLLSR